MKILMESCLQPNYNPIGNKSYSTRETHKGECLTAQQAQAKRPALDTRRPEEHERDGGEMEDGGIPEHERWRKVLRTTCLLYLLCAAARRNVWKRLLGTSGDDRKTGKGQILGHLKIQPFTSGLKRVDVNFDIWYNFWVGFIIIWNGNSWQDSCH